MKTILSLLAILVLLPSGVNASDFSEKNVEQDLVSITSDHLFILVNQERIKAGLPTLEKSVRLDQVANLKIQDQEKHKYFNHTSPQGLTPWHWFKEVGYSYRYAGENLARNYNTYQTKKSFKTSQDVVNAWMESSTHRANILNPKYVETGIAVSGKYEVQVFGTSK